MCGILYFVGSESDATECLAGLSHRGPDQSKVYVGPCGEVCLGHALLSIVGVNSSLQQPYTTTYGEGSAQRTVALCVNGEIYNWADLCSELGIPPTACDCQVLLPYYLKYGLGALCQRIRGVFALLVVEWAGEELQSVHLARDPLGVKPLFYATSGPGVDQLLAASSTVRSLPADVEDCSVVEVSPGSFVSFPNGMVSQSVESRFYRPAWDVQQFQSPFSHELAETADRQSHGDDCQLPGEELLVAMKAAVRRRVLAHDGDKISILLSGGVDSAIVAALAREVIAECGRELELHTFTATYQGSSATQVGPGLCQTDAHFARAMSSHIRSVHHEVLFTIDDAMAALPDVITHLETFDVITIRAALPLYLLCRKVAEHDMRVVLCGEGADELFAGYSLFEKFDDTSIASFNHEIVRRLSLISGSELLRVDRMTMAHGVEARVPFLDVDFVDVAMNLIPALEKLQDLTSTGRIEKFILRRAFQGLVPHTILYRKKVQFADGVGSAWNEDLVTAVTAFASVGGALTTEAAAYKKIFDDTLGASGAASVVSKRNEIRRQRRQPASKEGEAPPPRTWNTVANDPQLGCLLNDKEVADALFMLLRVRECPPPSLQLVNRIIGAMLQKVPFQNVTILTREKRPPTPLEVKMDVLTGIGGGCATVNSFLGALLSRLGFDVCLMPASILQEDCHVTLLLQWEGLLYYVDVGNAYPYTTAARLGDPTARTIGDRTWRLRAEGNNVGVEHMSSSVAGKWHSAVKFNPRRTVHFAFFLPMIVRSRTDTSFGPFLHSFRLARFDSNFLIVAVRDRRLLTNGGENEAGSAREIVDFIISHYSGNPTLVGEAKAALKLLLKAGHLTFPASLPQQQRV